MLPMGEFAKQAAPYASGRRTPEIGILLHQSLQLSVFYSTALEAQQACVRALYHYARASAYMVGEYQMELLGRPKLILRPSPWILLEKAWLSFGGQKTTFLERAALASGRTFEEKPLGKGKVLYISLPIELSDNQEVIGAVYRTVIDQAGVRRPYATTMDDSGLLVSPTDFDKATLYVLTSESSSIQKVTFCDTASGKEVLSALEPGRAALLLVSHEGNVLVSYNWRPLDGRP